MKKSFSLIITIILITIFSSFSIFIIEKKSMTNSNLELIYLNTQANLHMQFFKEFIKAKDLKEDCSSSIEFSDGIYNFYANINYLNNCSSEEEDIEAHLFIDAASKFEKVRVYEKLDLRL